MDIIDIEYNRSNAFCFPFYIILPTLLTTITRKSSTWCFTLHLFFSLPRRLQMFSIYNLLDGPTHNRAQIPRM